MVDVMNSKFSFLGYSKIARRIIFIFICGAIIPVGALSILSYGRVTENLYEQSQRRLRQSAKALGMSVYERLLFLETDMKMTASSFSEFQSAADLKNFQKSSGGLDKRFRSMAIVTGENNETALFGSMKKPPEPSPEEIQHMLTGKTLVAISPVSKRQSIVWMMTFLSPQNPETGILAGEIETVYLWGIGHKNALPPLVELVISDSAKNVLISSILNPGGLLNQSFGRSAISISKPIEWESDGQTFLVKSWPLFLKPVFFTGEWTITLVQSKEDIFAPVNEFQRTFSLIIIMTFLLVALLSAFFIRKSLVPVGALKEGTIRIANGDFNTKVDVVNKDELGELALSFNSMAEKLNKQFKMLNVMADIDKAILSTLETEKIIDTIFKRMPEVFPCDRIVICLFNTGERTTASAFIGSGREKSEKKDKTTLFSHSDLELFEGKPEYLLFHLKDSTPDFLKGFDEEGIQLFLILPIYAKEKLSALIAIGYVDSRELNMKEVFEHLQMADQIAVALSNADLVRDLNQLNLGTLTALARTVDAKSSWTAGHSERVTEYTLAVGGAMGLNERELETLQRAALLHDIGKIGVSADILDKTAKLDDTEFREIQTHSRLGARILEPIGAYSEAIPIILQHHERHDGTGYPYGLIGDSILIGARIIAVCDVYDALTNDRPYRKAWDQEKVIDLIKKESGKQFDPKVVEVFMSTVVSPEET